MIDISNEKCLDPVTHPNKSNTHDRRHICGTPDLSLWHIGKSKLPKDFSINCKNAKAQQLILYTDNKSSPGNLSTF